MPLGGRGDIPRPGWSRERARTVMFMKTDGIGPFPALAQRTSHVTSRMCAAMRSRRHPSRKVSGRDPGGHFYDRWGGTVPGLRSTNKSRAAMGSRRHPPPEGLGKHIINISLLWVEETSPPPGRSREATRTASNKKTVRREVSDKNADNRFTRIR